MQNGKLNVMQIILNLDRAGAQEVVRTLVDYLAAGGCVPVVCTFQDGPLRRDIEQLGVKVEVLPPRRYSIVAFPLFIIDMIRIWRQLARLVKKYNIDIVQTHLLEALDFLVLTLPYGTNLHVVLWTFHNADFLPTMKHWLLKPKRFVYRLLYRLTVSKVDGFIAVSDEVRASMIRQIGPIQNKVMTISNGVDVRRYNGSKDKEAICRELHIEINARLVATVGRLTIQKGYPYLMDAASTVVPLYPNTHFLFIGDGELREELQHQVQQIGLTENIHFLGQRQDVPALLMAADVFVLPSLWEGLSMALLEAMAAGRPIVATAVSGTTQVMVAHKTGLIVPPKDAPALADAIMQLLSNPAQAQTMGQAAKQHVEMHHSAQKQAEEHLVLYRRLLAQSIAS